MTMSTMIPAGAIALALALTACSGEAATQNEDGEEAAEATAETEEGAAAAHDASGYAEDETDGLVDPALFAALNEKLAAFHADSGQDVHIILAMTTDGADIETVAEERRAERDADALIYVAGADQALAVVGEGLDEAFTGDTEVAMIAHFEENELAEGLNAGADALIARLGD